LPSIQRAMDLIDTASEREREWITASYYALNHYDDQALSRFEAMVVRYPDDFWILQNVIDIYQRTGRRTEIPNLQAQIRRLHPNNFRAQAGAASDFLQIVGLETARPYVDRAKILMPKSVDPSDVWTINAKIWTLLFPAHDMWTQGRASEASRFVDEVSSRPELEVDLLRTMAMAGAMRMALGQLGRAETLFNQADDPNVRTLGLAQVAWARGNRERMLAQLNSYQGTDLVAACLWIRAGDPRAARRFLSLPRVASAIRIPIQASWAANEIEQALGDSARIDDGIRQGAPWASLMTGARTFLYAETLAAAADAKGKTKAAIEILEKTSLLGPRTFPFFTQSGVFWIRDQKRLADLYRKTGELEKARNIENDLLARLAVADPDYPLLVELKNRAK